MKIAFLCLNLVDTLRRAEAFIKNEPHHDFTIVIVREDHDREARPPKVYSIPYPNVDYIEDAEFVSDNFDLVLPNNDKACKLLFSEVYGGQLPNLSDKVIFQRMLESFGKFDLLETSVDKQSPPFADDSLVIAKPANSSGGYSSSRLCYNKRRFFEVQHFFGDDSFLIQEYRDSNDILLLSFASNGGDLVLYDIVEQEFGQSKNLNIFTSFMKSNLYLRDGHQELIEKTREFFNFCGFGKFKGFFGVQFLRHDGKFFPIDCNLRTGPLAMEIELRNLLDTRMYKAIPFFLGSAECKEYLENPTAYEAYLCYAEENGHLTTAKPFTPNTNSRIQISSDKTSGTFRKDYTMFIERA